MTPHLVRFKSGDEYTAMTRGGRRYHQFRPGIRAGIKRAFRRRERRVFKEDVLRLDGSSMEAASEWVVRPRLLEALRDDEWVKAALADDVGCWPSFRQSGKPGRGEYLASQPARWQRSARERLSTCMRC